MLFFKKDPKKFLAKELQAIEAAQQQLQSNYAMKTTGGIREKIPPVVKTNLEKAFAKAFTVVFTKGTSFIEKTYNKEQLDSEFDRKDETFQKSLHKKNLRRIERRAKSTRRRNSTFAFLEGIGLGMLGIGLPDIPLFIAVILKTIYQIAGSYGFDHDSAEEQTYILRMLRAILGGKIEDFADLSKASQEMVQGGYIPKPLDEEIALASARITDGLLVAKFIQGLPLIGIVGGIYNRSVISKISKYANLEYKKRYLLTKQMNCSQIAERKQRGFLGKVASPIKDTQKGT